MSMCRDCGKKWPQERGLCRSCSRLRREETAAEALAAQQALDRLRPAPAAPRPRKVYAGRDPHTRERVWLEVVWDGTGR